MTYAYGSRGRNAMCRGPANSRVRMVDLMPSAPEPTSSDTETTWSSPLSSTTMQRPSGENGTWRGGADPAAAFDGRTGADVGVRLLARAGPVLEADPATGPYLPAY